MRVPHADGSLHALPPGGLNDADACMFSDVFPTAYERAARLGIRLPISD